MRNTGTPATSHQPTEVFDADGKKVAGVSSRRLEEHDAEAAWHAADLRDRTALLTAADENAREQLTAARAAMTTGGTRRPPSLAHGR